MPKKNAAEVGSKFLTDNEYFKQVMELVPAEKKNLLDNIFAHVGEGVLRQDEFSRAMDAVAEKDKTVDVFKAGLDDWYGKNVKQLEAGIAAQKELETLKRGGAAPASGDLSKLEGYIKKDEVEKLVSAARAQSEETGLQVFSHLANLTTLHLHKYGEPINAQDIIAEARKQGTSLDIAFATLTKDREEKLAAQREKDREKKLRQEIEAELRQKMGHGAYPIGEGDVGTSPVLVGLGAKPAANGGGDDYGVQAAVNEYWRMNRPGASS